MVERRKENPGRREGDMVAALQGRMDTAEAWYSQHDKECAERYKSIDAKTDLLPEMMNRLDEQDEVLSIIRAATSWIKSGKKLVLALIGIAGLWQGVNEAIRYILMHWHS